MGSDNRASTFSFAELMFSPTAMLFEGSKHAGTSTSIFVVTTRPGDFVELHTHPYPETFVVLAGQGRWTAGDDVVELGPEQILVVPANTPHGFRNVGDEPLLAVTVHESGALDQTFLGRDPA